MKRVSASMFALCTGASSAFAIPFQYEYARNEDLQTQINVRQDCLLPQTDSLSLMGNFSAFWNTNNNEGDYWHSGFWQNLYGEYRPHSQIQLNLKLALFGPSNSYGYDMNAGFKPFYAATWIPETPSPLKLKFRAGDLNRQTLGAGLLIDEKEMSGASTLVTYGDVTLEVLKPGTSVFELYGDSEIVRANFFESLAQFSWFNTRTLSRRSRLGRDWNIDFWSASSQWRSPLGVGYAAEIVRSDEGHWGYLLKSTFDADSDWASVRLELGGRKYDRLLLSSFLMRIDQDYVSAESRGKHFVTLFNLLPHGVPEMLGEGVVTAELFRQWQVRIALRNEFSRVKYYDLPPVNYYAFDNGIEYCPLNLKNACGKIAYSNIVVDSTSRIDPVMMKSLDVGYKPFVIFRNHLRVDARMEF